MKRVSLPEERLLMGKAQSFGALPFTLADEDDPMREFHGRIQEVYFLGKKFSTRERDQIIARLALNL